MSDEISGLILEDFRLKNGGGQELQHAANLRVIRDAQISLCDIFGKI
jgi:hypothetical protein